MAIRTEPAPTYPPVDTSPRPPVIIPDQITITHYHQAVDPFSLGIWLTCGSCLGMIMAGALLFTAVMLIAAVLTLLGVNLVDLWINR